MKRIFLTIGIILASITACQNKDNAKSLNDCEIRANKSDSILKSKDAAKRKLAERYKSDLLMSFNLTVAPSPALIPIGANKVDPAWLERQRELGCLAYSGKIKICDYDYYFVDTDKLTDYVVKNQWFDDNQDKICYALLEQSLAIRHIQAVEPLGTSRPQPVCTSMTWGAFKAEINRQTPAPYRKAFDEINYQKVVKLSCSQGTGTPSLNLSLENLSNDQTVFSMPSLRALEKYRGLKDGTMIDIYFENSGGKPLLLVHNANEYNTVVYNFSGTLP